MAATQQMFSKVLFTLSHNRKQHRLKDFSIRKPFYYRLKSRKYLICSIQS